VAPEKPNVTEKAFDAYYFAHCCGKPYGRTDEWLAFFGGIADRIVADFRPRRVLDAGCAFGFLVEALRNRGVESFGIDLSPYAIEHVHESVKPHCRVGSVSDALDGPYDLIVSIEVLEHMEAREAECAIENLCSHTREVLFSSSPLDYREPTHINVQPPEAWAEQFARRGFFRDVDYDASFITAWAARFRKSDEPLHRLVRQYERRYWLLQHEASDARAYAMEVQSKLAETERRLDEAQAAVPALAEARNTIAFMESSRFWKLRNTWVKVKKLFRKG
jgi:SAM-dependent methyltransferase